jgi:methionyl-tRNA synthetase
MAKKRLVTSALPYVNNIPHLGNLIQVLSADVFARYCRMRGYETLYVCGTDEYGTATETRALEEGISPRELCDRYHAVHAKIYSWFNIAFDRFGRTSTPKHTEITQSIFRKLDENGFVTEKTTEQLYCENDKRFLADRYVRGVCPNCGYEDARGDQCESCGKLLDPTDLITPRCGICGSTPVPKRTKHLYIDLPAILPRLEEWMKVASEKGAWARNAIQMTQAWIRDGLHERAITRDLSWGIPVPKPGFEGKVFYVWFDAPIGYISITANHTDAWESWWKNPDEVELFQFIGKDNIPFHTVIFPSSLLGTGERWTLLHHMSSSEYLNYEGGKFSKSKGTGVFGTDALETGIPADVWRFYIFYNRPEKSDSLFTWKDFQEKVNGELIGNLGNLVNRTLTFVSRYYDGTVPEAGNDPAFQEEVRRREQSIGERFEGAELRDALREVLALSSYGNKAFQDGEPWKTRKTAPEQASRLIGDLVYLVKDLSILVRPFIPETADRIAKMLGTQAASWDELGKTAGLGKIGPVEILFSPLEDERIEELRVRFSGSQKERNDRTEERNAVEQSSQTPEVILAPEERFGANVALTVARIEKIERHPKADKLYIETINLGTETRQIVSGLVPYYTEEELLGKHIIVVSNLKPAKLRGVESNGMLLAAESDGTVEVLFVPDAAPGTRVTVEGIDVPAERLPSEIDIDTFFSIPISVTGRVVNVNGKPLVCSGVRITSTRVENGKVG